MGQTIQDLIREQDNAKRKARGAAADASAGSKINTGDFAAAARANARKRAGLPAEEVSLKPQPKAGVIDRLKITGNMASKASIKKPNAQRDYNF